MIKKIGMIIELKYDESSSKALLQAQKYIPILEKYKYIQTFKSLGISISQKKNSRYTFPETNQVILIKACVKYFNFF